MTDNWTPPHRHRKIPDPTWYASQSKTALTHTAGPTRTKTDEDNPTFQPPPFLGFGVTLDATDETTDDEPLTWTGDYA